MNMLCTICARGGSLGVKNKNIRRLRNKPLIAHSILQAKKSNLFDKIVVSSDSPRIREVALEWGADAVIVRPAEMATASAAKLPVIQHALLTAEKQYGKTFDYLVDLDATSPLRTVEDIVNAFHNFLNSPNATNLVTGVRSRKSPYFNMLEYDATGSLKLVKPLQTKVVRRQDAPVCYDMNASIYIWTRGALFELPLINEDTILFEMPEERSIDIDSPIDWQLVKLLAKTREDLA